MNKDINVLLESIKEDLIESKQIMAQSKAILMEGLEILSKF